MREKLYPFKFNAIFKQYIWGGEGFEKLSKYPPDNFAAECWEIACHKDGMSVVAEGKLKDKTLERLVHEYGAELLGKRVNALNNTFPLLVKFINAKNKLSVQVHPDDKYALEHENEYGKREVWLVLDAKEDAELIVGIKNGVDKDEFKRAIEDNGIDTCVDKIKVKAGDIVYIPSGTIHAVCEGIMIAEIQQNSNITYRIHDYNRKDKNGNTRSVHIKEALDVINFSSTGKVGKAKGIVHKIGHKSTRNIAVANNNFCVEILDINEELQQNTSIETFLIYIAIEGAGKIIYENENIIIRKGDTYLIPASLGEFKIEGKMKLIKSYIPDLAKDILLPLEELGYSKDVIFSDVDGLRSSID